MATKCRSYKTTVSNQQLGFPTVNKTTINNQVHPYHAKPTFQDFGKYIYVYGKLCTDNMNKIPIIYIPVIDQLYELYHL
jgi:hypothetical protein